MMFLCFKFKKHFYKDNTDMIKLNFSHDIAIPENIIA